MNEIHFNQWIGCDIFAGQLIKVSKHYFAIFLLYFLPVIALGQTSNDSLRPINPDTTANTSQFGQVSTLNQSTDSSRAPVFSIKELSFRDLLQNHPYFNFFGKPVSLLIQERKVQGDEKLFYAILLLLFYYALIKILFQKYLGNIFALFFRATLRQQQIREQVLQNPLPSLLLNILFVVSAGMYAALLAEYYRVLTHVDFWALVFYCILGLTLLYSGKFLVLKTFGWILRISKAIDTYLFIIFMVNKMVGIFLLPVLLFLAFPYQSVIQIVVTVSLFVLAILLGYRLLLSYRGVRSEIRVKPLHFFLYICAFEIAPVLLIYKVLLTFIAKTN